MTANNALSTRHLANVDAEPLLSVRSVSKSYGTRTGCRDISFDLWPGEVLAIAGESGSGKTTLLNCISARLPLSGGHVLYRMRDGVMADLADMEEADLTDAMFSSSKSGPPAFYEGNSAYAVEGGFSGKVSARGLFSLALHFVYQLSLCCPHHRNSIITYISTRRMSAFANVCKSCRA